MDGVNFVIRKTLDEEKIFANCQMCASCGGECCKSTGCVFSPEDFYVFRNYFSDEQRLQYLIAFLKRGYASIDQVKLYDKVNGAFKCDINNLSIFDEDLFKISYKKIENGDGALYLRVRNKGHNIVDVLHLQNYYTEGCVLLSKNGCPFPLKKRPKGGRLLRPKLHIDSVCIPLYTEVQAAIDWYPYQKILFKAYEYFLNYQN